MAGCVSGYKMTQGHFSRFLGFVAAHKTSIAAVSAAAIIAAMPGSNNPTSNGFAACPADAVKFWGGTIAASRPHNSGGVNGNGR